MIMFAIHETFLTFESDSSKNHCCFFRYKMRKHEFKISDERAKQLRMYSGKANASFLEFETVLPSKVDVRNKMKNTVRAAKRTKMVSIVTISKRVVMPSGFFFMYQMIMVLRK